MIIDFAGISFNSGVPDENGCLWYVTEWEGWGSPNVRQSTVEPTSKDGLLVANALLDARALGLTILCKAPTVDAFWLAWNYIIDETETMLYDVADFVVWEGTTGKKVGVNRVGDLAPKMLGNCAFEANLNLMAPDPKKYPV